MVARWYGPTAAPFEDIFEKHQCIEARPPQRDLHGQHFEGLAVDRHPNVHLLAVHIDVRLIDCHLLALLAVKLEQIFELVKPAVYRLV